MLFKKVAMICVLLAMIFTLAAAVKPVSARTSCADLSVAMAKYKAESQMILTYKITSLDYSYLHGQLSTAQYTARENALFAQYLEYRLKMMDAQIAYGKSCTGKRW